MSVLKINNMNFKTFLGFFIATFLMLASLTAQNSPVGIWKTVDDNTGEARSHIEIFEENGKLYGKIVKLLQKPSDTVCDNCSGDKKGKPLIGMELLSGLKTYKDYWSYGRIMDPDNGKVYKCSVWMEGTDKLKVRGYIGFSALGRTQVWHKVE